MHPFERVIEQIVAEGIDFYIQVGGDSDLRLKMGLSRTVISREPLILNFPASHHQYSQPTADENGLHCVLSFDALYNCRIPWSAIHQVGLLVRGGEVAWPAAWEPEGTVAPAAAEPVSEDDAPLPDNVRLFRPRK